MKTITTITGREIPYPPAIRTETSRKASIDCKKVDDWLISQGIDEAISRNDEYNLLMFRNLKNLYTADRDLLNYYLFDKCEYFE